MKNLKHHALFGDLMMITAVLVIGGIFLHTAMGNAVANSVKFLNAR